MRDAVRAHCGVQLASLRVGAKLDDRIRSVPHRSRRGSGSPLRHESVTPLQSRYIQGIVRDHLIGCLYLPNGNPAPGPKFDYKLRWFERLIDYAGRLLATGAPVVLAGDYNVMPTELDVYKPDSWVDDG